MIKIETQKKPRKKIQKKPRNMNESGVSLKAQAPSYTSYRPPAAQKIQITPIVKNFRVKAH